jgi:hypothetical protein
VILIQSNNSALNYNKGTVSFLNNGYELGNQSFGNFIKAENLKEVVLIDVMFEYNVQESPIHEKGFINLDNVLKLTVENCSISYNYVNAILKINNKALSFN